MPKLGVVVEGPGDLEAVGRIIFRTMRMLQIGDWHVRKPVAAKGCSNIDKDNGLEKFVRAASYGADAVIVVRDGDRRGAAPMLAHSYATRIREYGTAVPVGIAVPVKEMENWFVGSLETIRGKPLGQEDGIPVTTQIPADVEAKAGKAIIKSSFRSYKESVHQRMLANLFDPELCLPRSCSFQVFCRRLRQIDVAVKNAENTVFPLPA